MKTEFQSVSQNPELFESFVADEVHGMWESVSRRDVGGGDVYQYVESVLRRPLPLE